MSNVDESTEVRNALRSILERTQDLRRILTGLDVYCKSLEKMIDGIDSSANFLAQEANSYRARMLHLDNLVDNLEPDFQLMEKGQTDL